MFFNTRTLKPLFMALFIAATVFFADAQERGDVRLTHRFSWTDDPYALRYEVLVEQEADGVFSSFLRESTYQAYMLVSLPPGIFRLRVIPFDIRDIAATGTPWRYFRVVALQIQDPQLVADGVPPQEPLLVVEDIPQPREGLTAADEQSLQPVREQQPMDLQLAREVIKAAWAESVMGRWVYLGLGMGIRTYSFDLWHDDGLWRYEDGAFSFETLAKVEFVPARWLTLGTGLGFGSGTRSFNVPLYLRLGWRSTRAEFSVNAGYIGSYLLDNWWNGMMLGATVGFGLGRGVIFLNFSMTACYFFNRGGYYGGGDAVMLGYKVGLGNRRLR